MNRAEIAILVLRYLSFLVWFGFTAWYGIFRRWEKSEYGINTFLVSLAITAITFLLVVNYYVGNTKFIIFAQIPVYVTVIFTGAHRLALLKFGNTRDGGKRRHDTSG